MPVRLTQKNAVFVHIPKCGGTFVREVLAAFAMPQTKLAFKGSRPINHCILWMVDPHVTPDFSFAFVRHPLTFYESWWKAMFRGTRRDVLLPRSFGWHPYKTIAHCWSDDFNKTVRRIVNCQPAFVTRLYETYCGQEGKMLDYIGRMETLNDDLYRVLGHLGYVNDRSHFDLITDRLGAVNRSPCRQVAWDGGLKREVKKLERHGMRMFYDPAYANYIKNEISV